MRSLFFLTVLFFLFSCSDKKRDVSAYPFVKKEIRTSLGYDLKHYDIVFDTVKKGDTFGTILGTYHIMLQKVLQISKAVKPVFNTRKIKLHKRYAIAIEKADTLRRAVGFMYFDDAIHYTHIAISTAKVTRHKRPTKTVLKKVSGIIESSLFETLTKKNIPPIITIKLSEIYAWTIDFFRIDKGDRFKIIYEQHYTLDGVSVAVGRIKSAFFEHRKTPFYAFSYRQKGRVEYFDELGGSLRRTFLKAPLKYGFRISSRYNLRRKIRYYNRVKPHKGTDFAAPRGTPIISTADGRVIASRYRGGNGNYVKIRHNGTYTTQYLHMQKRAVRKGQYVRQGQVIGWIGTTGNASGPHVCYRFWKNGRQVDALKQKLPRSKSLKGKTKKQFLNSIVAEKTALDAIKF